MAIDVTTLPGATESLLAVTAEALVWISVGSGSFDPATQVGTPGATVEHALAGVFQLVEEGIDGVTVRRGDVEIFLAAIPIEQAGFTPRIGDRVRRSSNGTVLTVTELEHAPLFGYWRVRARAGHYRWAARKSASRREGIPP